MTLSWPNLAIGFVVGLILGAIADWQIGSRFRKWSELRALNKEYGSLAGQYKAYRIREDGTHEPTGEIVEISWQPKEGLLDASGFHAGGNPEWHSYIRITGNTPGRASVTTTTWIRFTVEFSKSSTRNKSGRSTSWEPAMPGKTSPVAGNPRNRSLFSSVPSNEP